MKAAQKVTSKAPVKKPAPSRVSLGAQKYGSRASEASIARAREAEMESLKKENQRMTEALQEAETQKASRSGPEKLTHCSGPPT